MKANKIIVFIFCALFQIILFSCSDENPVMEVGIDHPYLAAERQNFDGDILCELITEINNDKYGVVYSLLIMRNDSLVLEEYFNEFEQERKQDLCSVTKSIVSGLVGIAIDKNKIESMDEKIFDLLPEYAYILEKSPEKDRLRLHHLLSMTADFMWDEWSVPYGELGNSLGYLVCEWDWVKYVLELPLVNQPGVRFVYNSGCSHLLSAIIQKKTRMKTEVFAREYLFNKIGIETWTWFDDPQNITVGWGSLMLRPVDLMKIGQLFVNNGNWNSDQIISKEWIQQSTQKWIDKDYWGGYGYQWHLYSDGHPVGQLLSINDAFFGWGYGGEYLWVVPSLKLVVVSTAENGQDSYKSQPMFWEYILRAIKDR